MILASKTLARFTSIKKHDGNINIKNHPCKTPIGPAAKYILDHEGGIDDIEAKPTPDFSKIATTKEGMFMAEDDYCKSYYYRGAADNWVSFAGFYWRIIRINGDGSIRLIFSGTNKDHIFSMGYSPYSETDNSESYADYKVSDVKTFVENWYKTNILDKQFNDRIADPGFCNDITKYNTDKFSGYSRLIDQKNPTLRCPDKNNDLLTVKKGTISYPGGLPTLDEVAIAGGVYYDSNTKFYLSEGYSFLTMTPISYDDNYRSIGCHGGDLQVIASCGSSFSSGIRVVINLKSDVIISSGDGTELNPYVIN